MRLGARDRHVAGAEPDRSPRALPPVQSQPFRNKGGLALSQKERQRVIDCLNLSIYRIWLLTIISKSTFHSSARHGGNPVSRR